MAWFFKNFLAGLLLPPCNLLLLQFLVFGLWKRRPRLARALFAVSLLGLTVCSMPGSAVKMIEMLEGEIAPVKLEDPAIAKAADAIVVLGGGRILGARDHAQAVVLSPQSLLRLHYAMELKRRTGKPILVTGGKPGAPGPSEAELMDRVMRDEYGTKADWVEGRADNTAENAFLSRQILGGQGIQRIFLVTNAWHMPRALLAFRHVGFEVVPAPMGFVGDGEGNEEHALMNWIPSARGLEMSYLAMHEGMGAIWYHLREHD